MIAKLAYLTTPAPGRYVLNIRPDGLGDAVMQFEITRAHLTNILVSGMSLMLREESSNRVPSTSQEQSHERTGTGAQ